MIKLGIIMDPIENIDIRKDSSFAMLLEAQRRNYHIYYMEMKDLYLVNSEARATTRNITIKQNYNKWYEFGINEDLPLSELDVILMRKNPPFDIEYIYCTYILEHAEKKGTFIINKPKSLRDCNEKFYTTWFSELMPETLISRKKSQFISFYKKHCNIILKPLNRMGGDSVFFLGKNDPNSDVIIETLTKYENCYCMAQNYISSIVEGDKRVLVIDGNPVPYCLARIPKSGKIRGNLAAGGRGEVRLLTKNDKEIVRHVAPVLKKKGLVFAGLDIIGNYLTEINVTSPTGIKEIEKEFSFSIVNMLMEVIEKRIYR